MVNDFSLLNHISKLKLSLKEFNKRKVILNTLKCKKIQNEILQTSIKLFINY
jgi:hypothetical protein